MSDDVASTASSPMCFSLPGSEDTQPDIPQPDSIESGSLCCDFDEISATNDSDCDDVIKGKGLMQSFLAVE